MPCCFFGALPAPHYAMRPARSPFTSARLPHESSACRADLKTSRVPAPSDQKHVGRGDVPNLSAVGGAPDSECRVSLLRSGARVQTQKSGSPGTLSECGFQGFSFEPSLRIARDFCIGLIPALKNPR